MPFVKLDTGILKSTLWIDLAQSRVFLTALLLAEPLELVTVTPQLEIGANKETGFLVQPGWYGFTSASAPGLIHDARINEKQGMRALKQLGEPDANSRSPEYDGRRLVRVAGGFIVLNYIKYREKDHGAAARMKLYRQRKGSNSQESSDMLRVTSVTALQGVTYADADADADTDVEAEKESKAFSLSSEERKPKVDPRHSPFKEKLKKFWAHVNDGKELYWTGGDAKQLSTFLKEFPSITIEQFHSLLSNYKHSEGIIFSRTPKQFLPTLNLYMNGSLNKFKQPMGNEP